MKSTILQFITTLDGGGAERVVYELATRTPNSTVVALDGRGIYAAKLRERNIAVYDLNAYHKYDVGAIFRLRKILRDLRPAILHTHLFHANIIGRLAAINLSIPVTSTCHITEQRFRPHHFWLDKFTAKLARGEVCVSESVKVFQQKKTGLPDIFFTVIHNGVDAKLFTAPNEKINAREKTAPIKIGFLGRLDRQKGVDILINALRLIPPSLNDKWTALIAGVGAEEKNLRHLSAGMNNVHFVGYQSAPQDFLRSLDLCVMPSRFEGFGLVAVEAQLCGAVVVASALDALREIISPEKNGILFTPENHQELSAIITALITDYPRRQNLIASGIITAQNFSVEKMCANYDLLYQRIAPEKTSPIESL